MSAIPRTWEQLEQACHSCYKCAIANERTNVVIGVGNTNADLMFIGEGPGFYEDKQGEPFVGAAGKLLDKMLVAINLSRKDVYIANVIKCRPPQNRDPERVEIDKCLNFLRYQLMLVKPKIIVCLGRIAAKEIIDPSFRITAERGRWIEKKGFHIIATYHPSALLRDESKKKDAWKDMKMIRDKLRELKVELKQ